jgi:hypothetical protein
MRMIHFRDGELIFEPPLCSVIGTTAAIIASAVIGAGASIAASKAGQKSAQQAATVQQQAQASADAQFQQTRQDFAPWRAAGTEALGTLQKFGSEPGAFANYVQQDPGYQFGLSEGIRGIEANAASRGLLQSGATLKGLTRFGIDYANTRANDVWNRQFGIAQMGQSATGATAGYGAQNAGQGIASAANIGNAYMNAGAARASGYGGVATAANQGLQNYLLMDWLKKGGAGGYAGATGNMG